MLKSGIWEPTVYKTLKKVISENPSGTFWDVGAASGFHCIVLKRVFPTLNVIAIEPSLTMIKYLHENVLLNKVEILIVPCALGDDDKISEFYFHAGSNPGRSTLKKQTDNRIRNEKVICIRGDSLIHMFQLPAPDFLKIDTEGTTLSVLKGMQNILSKDSAPVIIMECFNEEFSDTWNFLQFCGYQFIIPLDEQDNYLIKK